MSVVGAWRVSGSRGVEAMMSAVLRPGVEGVDEGAADGAEFAVGFLVARRASIGWNGAAILAAGRVLVSLSPGAAGTASSATATPGP